ncbi:MAG: hypothetical protein Hyperionvirus1_46 [Hyperionvirus sp.]|uniref:Uncharacterized protein n=1 Tax=Hyperionvirus sp. TaxID=2487770 RepID=A0A3G5A5F6_9VIRU|nr:MAG: hypothetical protein Hyperionvirus1_46 [Hyperionvirus sp.]
MTKFGYYSRLFQNLGVPRYSEVINLLIAGEHDFYEKYARGFKGGEKIGSGKTNSFRYKFDGFQFVIREEIEDDRISYSILNNDAAKSICMLIFIPKDDNYAYIDNISYHPQRAVNGMPKTSGGTLMLKVTLDFIENDLKDRYKLKYMSLKDNSYFYCDQVGGTIDLDSLYMLTRGNTWYGKYGFVPFDSEKVMIDYDMLVEYKLNQRLVDIIPLGCTQIEEYILVALNDPKFRMVISKKRIKETLEMYKQFPIKKFFKDFLEKYDKTCGVFAVIYKNVMRDVGMRNLHGVSYYKLL